MKLVINIFAGSLVHQCLLLSSLRGVINKTHVDVDGVIVRNAILDSDWLIVELSVLESLHGVLSLLRGVELHQPPVMEDSILLSNLEQ